MNKEEIMEKVLKEFATPFLLNPSEHNDCTGRYIKSLLSEAINLTYDMTREETAKEIKKELESEGNPLGNFILNKKEWKNYWKRKFIKGGE